LLLGSVADPTVRLEFTQEVAEIAEQAGEPDIAQMAHLQAAWGLGELGRSDDALSIVRAALSRRGKRLVDSTYWLEPISFAILLEGEHGHLPTAVLHAEDLRAALTTRTSARIELGGADAVVARLQLLTGDLSAAETTARDALANLAADPNLIVRVIATQTLAATLIARGEPDEAADLLSELARPGPILRGHSFLESAAEVAIAMGRLQTAADLLATSAAARTANARPPVPADRSKLERLRTVVAHIDAHVLDADTAVAAVRSLADQDSALLPKPLPVVRLDNPGETARAE
jgi:predicted negative regulator of RcsB-dependent stress response